MRAFATFAGLRLRTGSTCTRAGSYAEWAAFAYTASNGLEAGFTGVCRRRRVIFVKAHACG
jgi:hypothetical protein